MDSVALDLPSDEPDAGAHRYAEVVADAIGTSDDFIVVPHSLAGLYAPVVAEHIGALGVVNLAALTPEPGSSGLQQSKALPGIYTKPYRTAPMTRLADGGTAIPQDIACELLFHDVAPGRAMQACAQLRPQFWTPWVEPCAITAWPDLRYAHIACEGDRVLGAEGMHDGAERTAAPLQWIPGGHVPMLSHPREAAEALRAAIANW